MYDQVRTRIAGRLARLGTLRSRRQCMARFTQDWGRDAVPEGCGRDARGPSEKRTTALARNYFLLEEDES